jgi:hypothetical protein
MSGRSGWLISRRLVGQDFPQFTERVFRSFSACCSALGAPRLTQA